MKTTANIVKRFSLGSRWALGAWVCCWLQVSACLLFADTAPASIAGRTILVDVTSSSDPFELGRYALFISGATNTYVTIRVSDLSISDQGTYFYTNTGPDSATLTLASYVLRNTVTAVFQFRSNNDGTFSASAASGGTSGTFSLVVTKLLVPTKVVLLSPTGGVAAALGTQHYTWQTEPPAAWYDPAGIWYELYITRNGSVFADKWVTLSNSLVDSATGVFAVDVDGHSAGSYQWWVRGWNQYGLGPWSNPGNFSMATPLPPGAVPLLSPTNNATITNRFPQLSWGQSVPPADWFRLQVARNGSSYWDQWIEGVRNWTPVSPLPAGTYIWQVTTFNAGGLGPVSEGFTFRVPIAVPTNVVLLSPTASVAPALETQRYTWKADPAAVWYELAVARNGALFADRWFTLSNSVVDSATGNFAVDLQGHSPGIYQWWVRGWSPDGLGPWSSAASFSLTNALPPGAVTLLSPTNYAVLGTRFPQLVWSNSFPPADSFHLLMARDDRLFFDQPVGGVTNWTVASPLSAGTYIWWVQTRNSGGFGPASRGFTFTIPFAVPTNITLLSPLGGVTTNPTQRYTWQADPAAIWYELYVARNGSTFADRWLLLTNSVADGATNAFGLDVSGHSPGRYQWWVRGWSPDGIGPWSGSLPFQVQAP